MFNDVLKYLRKREHMTQQELANKLKISRGAVSMYELGQREPDFETLEAIADCFNVSMSVLLGKDETIKPPAQYLTDLQKKYNALDDHGRELVDAVLDIEYARCAKPVKEERKVKVIPLFPAAAGPGEPMETTAFQEYEVDAGSTAQFAVRISGDSMEPELHDGEVVLCVRRRAQIGELAVIMVNGFLYVKQYIADSFGNIYLRSLNRQRKDLDVDIMASGNDTVTGYGVVIHRRVPLVRE